MAIEESAIADDVNFLSALGSALGGLSGVLAVSLGGSRATGEHREDSDWDLALYYRPDAPLDPAELRALGWRGQVSGLGEWGGGVFNGGAWLEVDGRHVDVHYRDLDVVERELAEARAGRFRWEPLAFHLAGIPSYLVVAELAGNRVLSGSLPRPEFPDALRASAPAVWSSQALRTLAYATSAHAAHGRVVECSGLLAQAACQVAHAVLAARGQWVTNEKRLLERAGLRDLDELLAELQVGRDPVSVAGAVRSRLEQALAEVGALPAG